MQRPELTQRAELVQEQEPKTLLIVDDEPIIRQLCARALNGFCTLQAGNGKEALQILEKETVDIVLSDVMMPHIGGLELLRQIKQQSPDQAVILMTGYTEKEVILQALKAGADDFISKPINLLQLRTTVDKALDKLLLRQELTSLRQIDKLKSDFLGLISHKLKTPATALSLFIQNIADGIRDLEEENFANMLSMVQAETLHLEHLIQDLLYFSNVILQDDDLRLEPLELGRVARQVATALEPAAKSRKQSFVVNIDPPLPAEPLILDRQRITFAIRALLDNAIKFTPEGGSILLEGLIENNQVCLEVRDTGPGIPALELNKVFSKFYQIDTENTGQVRGFGLGLFYARDFVRSMGGDIGLESQSGLGTVATICFPLGD
jgi:signal transduction histidine kinase